VRELTPRIDGRTSAGQELQPQAGGVIARGDHQHDQLAERDLRAVPEGPENILTGIEQRVAVDHFSVIVEFALCDLVEHGAQDRDLDHARGGEERVGIHRGSLAGTQVAYIDTHRTVEACRSTLNLLLKRLSAERHERQDDGAEQ
jgi:hypothetical protein